MPNPRFVDPGDGTVIDNALGGRGLSKGYLNRPELTAEKFVKHPFIPDQVLYRSGDLAHWTTNGELQFNGRRDHQVKIKGFRIELGEIEYHLNQHHKVNHAVVLVTENSQDRYLEAYLTGTTDLNVQELRSYLSQQLPDYMIPLEFHSLEAFPLNKNGKIDTAQLRNINNKIDATAASYVAPRNDTEREIAAIWKEEFNLDQVSIETSFFDLGGDSIRAIRVLSKMNKVLGQKLEVADIFEHPSIQELIENTERPDDLINDSLKHEISERLDAYREEAVTVEGVQDAYPMSDIEIGMCYSYIANQGTGVYHDQFVYPVDLSGFDRNVFKKALDLMIQKHEVMRAAYELDKFSVPMRLIYETVEPKIEYSSITNLNAAEQQKHIEDFMSKERSDSHFDCTTPGMWKMTIFELSEQQHFMVFQFHHAIIDGWSRASFITELNNTYYQLQKDDEFLPEALEIGYKDFILEQEYLKASTQVDDFWRSYLSDYERLSCFTETIERENTMTRIDGPLYERLVAFCARNEVKLQTVLHTAYLFTLSRLSYESDLLTGYITSGRPVAERGDEIAGCFLNTVPFRCEIGNESLLQLVRKVEAGLTSLKRFENLSLAELQARFSSEANSENPFFDSFFNFTDFHIYEDALTSDGAPSETLDVGNFELTNTYLDVSAAQGEDRISVYWTRKRALSSHKTNQDLSSIFLAFVDQLLAQPNEPLAAVSYLTSEEQTLLDALTQTTVALPEEETFLDLFRARTEEQPESTAVIFNGTVLTYTELDQLSTQFASYLIKEHNIKPGAIVGIELPRNEWLIVVMLGIIKAGAAYVPLDKNYPQKRKDFIAQDTQYVLCANEIIVEDFRAKLAKFESNQLEVAVSPGDLAYIIYTSGSTGVPKGVLLRHSNLYSLLHQLDVQYGYEDAEKIAVTTNITFDISVLEIFGGLSQGKTLVVFGDDDLENDISRFISKLQKEAVDVLQATPTRFGLIKEAVFGGELPDLRHLILGGEPIPQSIFEKLASNPSLNAINGYGPTETTVYSSYKKLTDAPEVTIGKPLHNEQLYILNSHLQRQGVGVVGELCISGRGLSSGYLNRPEITAERFVPNPFQPGEMLYKTGDLARILPSGEVDYVGRNDDQVKIRGIRIELQDIEHQLGTHPLIDSVVVLAAAVTDGKELVAFITSEENIEAEDLRAYLMEQLPQYMIPSRFVQVAAIPRSHSGKVDRKKLLEMNRIEMETVVDVEPPKDEMEAGLLDIWKVLLEKEHLGVTDDFFVVGGNSLKAISFLGKVNQTYSVEITLADLFKYSNIRELAVCVQNKKWLDDATEIENENEVIL
ncbi:MAG: amino acid adenylation domain-containing protein [Bacteroidota bacterium]